MSPVAGLVSNLFILIVVLVVGRTMAPRLEKTCIDNGMESLYHRLAGIFPVVITIGIVYSVVGFLLSLVMKAVVSTP